MFANSCLGGLLYESTATAIAMAGVFISFLVEYIGNRLIMRRQRPAMAADGADSEQQISDSIKETSHTPEPLHDTTIAALGHGHSGIIGPDNHFNVAVLEAGIIFHSIRANPNRC